MTDPVVAAPPPFWPREPLAWLAVWWRSVLFPGPAQAVPPVSWRALLLLAVLPAGVLYPVLGFALFDPDEGRYAQIPREMALRGEWVVPYLQGEPYLDKPPLFYWVVRLSYAVFGVHDWAARVGPALAAHATLVLTYLLGRRAVGERAARAGAILLALAPAFGMARLVLLDGLLTLWVTAGLFCLYEAARGERWRWGWGLAAAMLVGLGVLTKGPIALVLTVPPVWAWRRLSGAGGRIGWGAVAAFAAVVAGVALPWYAAVALRLPAFNRHFLWDHNVLRFLAPFDHEEPVWFYAPVVLAGLLPGTMLLPSLGRWLASGDPEQAARRGPGLALVLLAGGWCVGFFSLSGCKLPTYVLPAFGPLALALGATLAARGWEGRTATRVVGGLAAVLVIAGHLAVLPWFARERAAMGRPEAVLALCADPAVPVVCHPRPCDSVAFYLGRDDVRHFRSKEADRLVAELGKSPRTVVLCTHDHTLGALKQVLPPCLKITREVEVGPDGRLGRRLRGVMGETALGLCDAIVVERVEAAPDGAGRDVAQGPPRR